MLTGSSTVLPPTQGARVLAFTAPATSPGALDTTQVKLEALTTTVTSLSEMLQTILMQQVVATKPKNTGATSMGMSGPSASVCNFCGIPGHYIRKCEIIEEYIQFGKCKRSSDNRVILPSGAQVPHSITGAWMRDRMDKWHWQNPGQMATQMYVEVMAALTAIVLLHTIAGQSNTSYPMSSISQYTDQLPMGVYALRRPPPHPKVVITTLPLHRRSCAGFGENTSGASSSMAPQRQQ